MVASKPGKEVDDVSHWLVDGGIFLNSQTPFRITQTVRQNGEWDLQRRKRLDVVYNSIPLPRYSAHETLDAAMVELSAAKYGRSMYVSSLLADTTSKDITSGANSQRSKKSTGDLDLAHEKLVRWIIPDDSSSSRTFDMRGCLRSPKCSRKVEFLPAGILNQTVAATLANDNARYHRTNSYIESYVCRISYSLESHQYIVEGILVESV